MHPVKVYNEKLKKNEWNTAEESLYKKENISQKLILEPAENYGIVQKEKNLRKHLKELKKVRFQFIININ